jgi:hypothetical protein
VFEVEGVYKAAGVAEAIKAYIASIPADQIPHQAGAKEWLE